MDRKAQVTFQTGWIYEITTDIERSKGRNVAGTFDTYRFGFYCEDESGRFVYLYQPDSSLKGIGADIESLIRNKRPSVDEFFDVDIINESTGEIFRTLHKARLVDILGELKDVFASYKKEG